MYVLFIKEIKYFFYSLIGIISLSIFIILMGLVTFFFEDTNVLDYGYASLEIFFSNIPLLYIFFISAISMRFFSDEFKYGTFELLLSKPLTLRDIVCAKFFASSAISILMFSPTILYIYTLQSLSLNSISLDYGTFFSSYIGLVLLILSFVSIGLYSSSLTSNNLLAFLLGTILCIFFFYGFYNLSKLITYKGNYDYFIEYIGIKLHYENLSTGFLAIADIVYFFTFIMFFLILTISNLHKRIS